MDGTPPSMPTVHDEAEAAFVAWTLADAELAAARLRLGRFPDAETMIAELARREAAAVARLLAARPTTLAGAYLLWSFTHKRRCEAQDGV